MEQNNCKPGFTLLKILDGQSANETETSNGIYLSSKKWKESSHFKHPKSTMNGPSTSGILGIFKHDMTEAIKLPIWPKIARGCIQRLLRRGWPDQETVLEMVKQGCHLVPKASRTSKYPDDEWTISFVIAEQILVAKLTHSQFLCYCLLKIFFREAVNDALTTKDRHEDNDTDFLSSYFAKTVVLWEVSAGRFQCNQENLLRNFRRCFRLILNWLSKDYVPNFFIPTNNMLEGKFTEQDKQTLMKHLTSLHKEGYRSFYRCSTLTNKEIGSLQHFGRFFEDMLEGTFKEQDKQTAKHLTSLHEEGYRFFYRYSTLTNKEIGSLQHFERFFEDMLEGTFKEQDKQTVIKHKERHRSFVKCSTLTNKEISLLQHFERFSEDRTGLIWTEYPKASEGIQSQFYASLVLAIENHDPCGASHYSEP
ncbi:hypothetical protein FSP39_022474 [Pinctada imbricata]|uniref:Uncharacterized protein n=1 Tax=Pinctada imbricata TaxID=66713 RepID=A0AA89BY12_PINIB|nr:hypothetical protein FSP39_022474 [Pinctada imbricata]